MPTAARSCALVLVLLTPGALAGQGGRVLYRVENLFNPQFGTALARVPDVDADGADELAVGNPIVGAPGVVQVFSGARGDAILNLFSSEFDTAFGAALAVGDVDGDGVADLVIGEPLADAPFTDCGRVVVVSGATHAVVRTWVGESAFDQFGSSLAVLEHTFTNDGFADVLVGAPFRDVQGNPAAGTAYLFSGANQSLLKRIEGPTAGARLGACVSSLGDLANGFTGFAVGAPLEGLSGLQEAGTVRVFDGAAGTQLYRIDGTRDFDHVGGALTVLADGDGDGTGELVLTALSANADGRVEVRDAADGTKRFTLRGRGVQDFGSAIAPAGDLNGDGIEDLLIGAELEGGSAGAAYWISGRRAGDLYAVRKRSPFSRVGRSVMGLGDVDGDGFADVAVGMLQSAGQVEVLRGSEFALDVSAPSASAGDTLALVTTESDLGKLTMTVAVAVDGAPIWLPLGGVGKFDKSGHRTLSGSVPSGIAGLEVDFLAIAFSRIDGSLVATPTESVLFQ